MLDNKMIQSVNYNVGIKIKYQALNQIFNQFWHIPTQVESQVNSQVHEFTQIRILIKTNLYFYTTLKTNNKIIKSQSYIIKLAHKLLITNYKFVADYKKEVAYKVFTIKDTYLCVKESLYHDIYNIQPLNQRMLISGHIYNLFRGNKL